MEGVLKVSRLIGVQQAEKGKEHVQRTEWGSLYLVGFCLFGLVFVASTRHSHSYLPGNDHLMASQSLQKNTPL